MDEPDSIEKELLRLPASRRRRILRLAYALRLGVEIGKIRAKRREKLLKIAGKWRKPRTRLGKSLGTAGNSKDSCVRSVLKSWKP